MLEILATLMILVILMGIIASGILFYVCYHNEKNMAKEKEELKNSRLPQ